MFKINFSKYGKYSVIFLLTILLLSVLLYSVFGDSKEGLTGQIPTNYYNSAGAEINLLNTDGSYYILLRHSTINQSSGIIFNSATPVTDLSSIVNTIFTNSNFSIIITPSTDPVNPYIATISTPTIPFNNEDIFYPTAPAQIASTGSSGSASETILTTLPTSVPTSVPTYSNNNNGNYNHYSAVQIPIAYYNNNGGVATLLNINNTYSITVSNPTSGTMTFTSSTPATDPSTITNYTFTSPTNSTATVISDNNGSYAIQINNNGFVDLYTDTLPTVSPDSNMYNNNSVQSNYTPVGPIPISTQGISQSNIPIGDQDLYMLKSQIVPPVCPACPALCLPSNNSSSNSNKTNHKTNQDNKNQNKNKNKDQSCSNTDFLPSLNLNTGYSTYGN